MAATSTLVDGGLQSNFPIDSLDRADGAKPRWPSSGVGVLRNLPEGNDTVIPALAPITRFGVPHLLESDFGISDNEVQAFHAKGHGAAEAFLRTWDWDAHLSRFR